MTEQELILRQSELGSDSFLVTKLGNFYSAYDCGAFALARATGYSVMRRPRRGGRFVLTTGFPVGRLDAVLSMIGAAGGCVDFNVYNGSYYDLKKMTIGQQKDMW